MCILVGGAAAGKTALARTAAALAGRPVLELTLTAGSDTSDLLGSFEQQEPSRRLQVLFYLASAQPTHGPSLDAANCTHDPFARGFHRPNPDSCCVLGTSIHDLEHH